MTSELDRTLWHRTCREQVDAPPLTGDAEADLAIIGGGFTGCSAALHAARAGARVRLLEAREIGYGGSGRNVGLVNAGLWLAPDRIRDRLGDAGGDHLSGLLAAAPDTVFSLIADHRIDCDPVRAGTLHCAHSPAGLRALRARHDQLTASGAPVRMLSAEETARRTGAAGFHGALSDDRAGTIQPLAYARGLARAAAGAGAMIHAVSPVRRVYRRHDVWHLETPGGTIRAGAVIQATNAYHDGLPDRRPASVAVHYFQFATPPLPESHRRLILAGGEGCWDTALIMTSFRMDRSGRLIIGAIGNLDGAGGAIHVAWARRKLAALFPGLAGQELSPGWCGRIAMTGDHIPRIVSPGPAALSAHGYSGRGIGPGTVFGKLMAHHLLGVSPSGLPVPVADNHRETLSGARAAWFEAGAVLSHLVSVRRRTRRQIRPTG